MQRGVCLSMEAISTVEMDGRLRVASVPGLPRSFTYAQFISTCGTHEKWGRPGLKYHVRIVGGAIGKALLLFPEARSPSHLVEELLASRIIYTTYGLLSIWLLR